MHVTTPRFVRVFSPTSPEVCPRAYLALSSLVISQSSLGTLHIVGSDQVFVTYFTCV